MEDTFRIFAGAGGAPASAAQNGSRLCRNLEFFHDGDAAGVELARGAPDGLRLRCHAAGASYVSFAAALSEAMIGELAPGRILQVHLESSSSRPLVVFVRLNLGSLDGRETHHETVIIDRGTRTPAFDLDGVRLDFDCRLSAWVDVIVSRPDSAEIVISDLRLRLLRKGQV